MPRMHRSSFARGLLGLLVATAGLAAQSARPPAVDFNRDVRPLLSDRCFQCHGFDSKARQAGLRLDTWEGLTGAIDGRRPVVPGRPEESELLRRIGSQDPARVMPPPKSGLATTAAERDLLRRWIAEGADYAPHWAFVPPRAPRMPAVRRRAWPRNPIDRFVLARLEKRGLVPSPPADRQALIRRASLDLTGLPPTPEEVDAFLADRAPDSYDRLVERLMASPRFGERMAPVWLDAARYADTNGFHHDNIRTAWPYRDWVIRAFAENKPLDEFVTEQLAGDLLPAPTVQQRIATAFCRMHNINDEGGALDPEYRVEAVCDRIETIATTFMGLTFTCARCHDHKYDPFTQDDYYSLYAYFDSVRERGVYPNNFEQARAYPARLDYAPPELAPRLDAARKDLAAAQDALAAAAPAIQAERAAWERELRAERGVVWVDSELVEASSAAGAAMKRLPDGSVLVAKGPKKDSHAFTLRTDATDLRLLRFEALVDESLPKKSIGLAKNGNAVVTRITAEAISVEDPARRTEVEWAWAWADHEQPNGDHDVHNVLRADARGWALEGHRVQGPRLALLLARQPFGYEGGTLVRVRVEYRSRYAEHIVGRPRIRLGRARRELRADFPVVAGDWWLAGPFKGKSFDAVYAESHGPEKAELLDRRQRFGRIAWQHRPAFTDGKTHALRAQSAAAFYLARTLHAPVARRLQLSLGSDDAIRVYLNGREVLARKVLRGVAPDQDKLAIALAPGENTIVLKIVNSGGPAGFYYRPDTAGAPGRLAPVALLPSEQRSDALGRRFAAEWGARRSPTYAKLQARVAALKKSLAELEGERVPVLVMSELDEPTETWVLDRGLYSAPNKKRPVRRRPPRALGGTIPRGAPANRLGFARWLVHRDHPLTARVHVNRLWQTFFGTGIVKTTENFGMQSEWPSHPVLLDWLATDFMRSGWDQKHLIRQIVTSATYRQSSSVRPNAEAVDPENRLLAYFPRRRLPAELVRDLALWVSGLLVERVGGPSVRPYQPPGLWKEVSIGGSSNTQVFRRDSGDALYRRSLYTFWKRTSPNPQMMLFDAPTREFCLVRRNTTNTPLQALVMWNDVQFVEAARALAQRTLREARTTGARIVCMFRRCTGRRPDAGERAILERTLRGFRARYERSKKDAALLLARGAAPPKDHDSAELAAWTMLGSTILCLDDTIVRG